MEKNIKTIFIVSIIAIVAFLGIQFYWLYTRYEYTVFEYEDKAFKTVHETIDEYYQNRDKCIAPELADKGYRFTVNYLMENKNDESGHQHRFITVTTRRFQPWRILGLESDRELTEAEQEEALRGAMLPGRSDVDSLVVSVAADNSPSDAANWSAGAAVAVEFKNPFTVSGIDSLLTKKGIDAYVKLVRTKEIVWAHSLLRNTSFFNPSITITVPYSPLERKSVEVYYSVPVIHILGDMLGTLIVATIISVILIVCLLWQFRIICRLNRLDKMRNSFVTTMVHELKRPISTLKMCVSGLRNQKMMADSTIREELLRDTKEGLDRLSTSFSKMRDLTFNNSNQIPINCETIRLSDLVNAINEKIVLPPEKKVSFNVEMDNNLEIVADKTHLSNVLINLIENSIKYSGERVDIVINASKYGDGSVSINVGDNGNGIPESDRNKIFTSFYRGGMAKTAIPGMGLGLAYVKLLVEAHGGSISFESHTHGEEKGTRFIINIPQ